MKSLTLQPNELVQLMQGKGMRVTIMVINLLLVGWIAWLLATLTLDLLASDEPITDSGAPAAVPTPVKQDQYQLLVRQMPDWHLMGEARVEKVSAKPAAPVDAPETHLKLTLRGAFASDDPDYARAIIADPRGQEEMYAIGDKLPGNAELREIKADRVILMRSGRYETLSLPELQERRNGSATGSRVNRSRASNPTQRLKSIRQSLKSKPKSLYGLIRTVPLKDKSGDMIGYTVSPGSDPDLFEQMGLQSGDVVTHINNVPLTNLSSGVRALKSAQSGDAVTVSLIRGGSDQGAKPTDTITIEVPE